MIARVARGIVLRAARADRAPASSTLVEDGRAPRLRLRRAAGAPSYVRDPRVWPRSLRGGRGLAEAYIDGLWDSPDLDRGDPRRRAQRATASTRSAAALTPVREPCQRARGAFARNTPQRSREDIAAHYDLGNELFELMLDPTMMYSCAIFERRDATLEEASLAKLELRLRQARPRPARPRARDRHRLGRLRRARRRARAAAA